MITAVKGFTCNVVAKNVSPGVTINHKINQKVQKLERHLIHYPPESVHLQVVLEKNERKSLHTVTLTLRVPSRILHCHKSYENLERALDESMKCLLREVEKMKAQVSGDYEWKQSSHRVRLQRERRSIRSSSGIALAHA
jgi:ribosomal subunit interface protein